MARMLNGIVAGASLLFFLVCSRSTVFHSIEGALVDTLHELVLSIWVGSRLVFTLKDDIIRCKQVLPGILLYLT